MPTNTEKLIYDGLIGLGIKFWLSEGDFGEELRFKYPPELTGDGRKDLFKFIKENEGRIKGVLKSRGL